MAWFAVVFAVVRWTIERGATPGSPETATFFAIVWASVVLVLTLSFNWRTGRNGAATVVGINVAMALVFAWMYS